MKKNNKGFTLAELLIVVAIIAVLVAVAIPVFSTQLEKSREATDVANVRNAYAQVVTSQLEAGGGAISMKVSATQKTAGWADGQSKYLTTQQEGKEVLVPITSAHTNGAQYTVTITESGSVTVG